MYIKSINFKTSLCKWLILILIEQFRTALNQHLINVSCIKQDLSKQTRPVGAFTSCSIESVVSLRLLEPIIKKKQRE